LEACFGEHLLRRGGRRSGASRRGHEETLHPKARPVSGFHLLLQQNPRTGARRGRNAAILSGPSAFRTSNGPDTRSPQVHRTHARAGTLPPSPYPPRMSW
jgi:hypothetical protein